MRRLLLIALAAVLSLNSNSNGQVTYTGTSDADTFLATGSPGNPAGTDLTGLNFGAAGALVVAPAASLKGEFQTVIRFNLASAVNQFNTSLGTNNWTISNISLQLTGNFSGTGEQPDNQLFGAINGGNFIIEWLSYDDWVEGTGKPRQPTTDGITYDSLPTLLSGTNAILCTNTFTPPGDNVPITWNLPLNTNFVADIANGGEVTLRLYAADDQIDYLFNSHEFGDPNSPLLKVTAFVPVVILSAAFTNGVFHISGHGASKLDYQIQVNTDLSTTNWQTMGTSTADDTGLIEFGDTSATNRQCFYRLMQKSSM